MHVTRTFLLICAIVCFALSAFGVNVKGIKLDSLGLAFFVATFL